MNYAVALFKIARKVNPPSVIDSISPGFTKEIASNRLPGSGDCHLWAAFAVLSKQS